MYIYRGMLVGGLGKVITTPKALARAQRLGLAVRAKSTGRLARPPLALIKSFLKIRMLEAALIRPVPDHLKSRMLSESQPIFLPHRCVLDDRNCWTDFSRQQQSDRDDAKQRKKMRRQWHGSLFRHEDITDLEP